MGLVRLRYRAQVSYRRLRFSRFGSKLRLGCNLGSDSMSGSLFSQNWSTMVNGSTPLFRIASLVRSLGFSQSLLMRLFTRNFYTQSMVFHGEGTFITAITVNQVS
uniref:Uncharacterized protein n=1 Tax=Helianthus annuus TaxID=4232 RepID=A0A251SQH5_HELAN